jgi:hypothetical protein
MCDLDGVSTGSLPGFGCESFVVVRYTGFVDGDCPGNLSLGQYTGDGNNIKVTLTVFEYLR